MINIEILYSDVAGLYGNLQNIYYLQRSCQEISIVEDKLWEEPYLVRHIPNLIYMGSTTEQGQKLIIENLRPYQKRLQQMIENGVNFLVTGNALEVFGQSITDTDGSVLEGLGLLPIETKRDMQKRYNAIYLGNFDAGDEEIKIAGYKSQFGHSYWTTDKINGWFSSERGDGLNPEINQEGIHIHNFYATYLIGALLVFNPPLARWMLRNLGVLDPHPAFEQEAMEAYDARLIEFNDPHRRIRV